MAEALEGTRGPDRHAVQGVLVPGEKDSALLEHPALNVEGELLEDHDVARALGQIREPDARHLETRDRVRGKDEAQIHVGRGRRLTPGVAPEENGREHSGVSARSVEHPFDGGMRQQVHCGHREACCANDRGAVKELRQELRQECDADVSKVADLERLIGETVKTFGRLDVMGELRGRRNAHLVKPVRLVYSVG